MTDKRENVSFVQQMGRLVNCCFCLVCLRQSCLLPAISFQNTREAGAYTEHPEEMEDHSLYPWVQQLFLSEAEHLCTDGCFDIYYRRSLASL